MRRYVLPGCMICPIEHYPPHFGLQKSKKRLLFYLVGLPTRSLIFEEKKGKMIGKVSETLQNECLACCLHKKVDKIDIRMVIVEW